MNNYDKRLIEDYLPIEEISAEASSEPRTKGHISTLHIWRARRPLAACRAAVYGALVPAPQNSEDEADDSDRGGSRDRAKRFISELSLYPCADSIVHQAQDQILSAHAIRLSRELNRVVTKDDIESGEAPRPRVLDLFAGGGAIPLEAARLGCESYAVELNPVAHLIELCTVAFPQQFGPTLADDVEKWGRQVLDKTSNVVGDLLLRVPRTKQHRTKQATLPMQAAKGHGDKTLSIVAHYWTRTAPCPNPSCKATVPLYRQTWLRRRPSGFVALKPLLDRKLKLVRFKVVEAGSESDLGFDPTEGSESSSTVCPFCRSVLEGAYVRDYGDTVGFGQQLMCLIALNPEGSGKLYLTDESLAEGEEERQRIAAERAAILEKQLGNSSLDQIIPPTGNAGLATGKSYLYGVKTFRQMFTPRQRCTLLAMATEIRRAHTEMIEAGLAPDRAKAITTYLAVWLSRLTDRFNGLTRWDNSRENIQGLTSMKRFAMAWDFPEVNIFGGASGDAWGNLEYITAVIREESRERNPSRCIRGSATDLPFDNSFFDAVITDPPYYDNESYSELSDVCYVWLRPTIGFLYPDDFNSPLTPKKKECVAAAYRQGGKAAAKNFYEDALFRSLQQAYRVSKVGAMLVLVYAHKTTLGWSTLVDSIRRSGFEVTEAWPLDTETKSRVAHQGDAALASSIFLVGRKRLAALTGSYETVVRAELDEIVRERVETLWSLGISGADLVIACIGAGLRAFTKYVRVEYSNGDEVAAERFLTEVETVVLDSILTKLSKSVGDPTSGYSLVGVDSATRFYILWRYTYRSAEMEAGESIVFANGTHVELDGPNGLSSGAHPLIEKRKDKYRLLDYSDRGAGAKLGMSSEAGEAAPVVDTLHRTLWLMEHHPSGMAEFIKSAHPNLDQMRLVAQALLGPALKGGELDEVSPTGEMGALAKLTANWKSVVEDSSGGPLFRAAHRT